MTDTEYNFRYFREPHRFSSYSSTPKKCEICGLNRPGYEGPFYGDMDVDSVCEPCLASGRLIEKGLSTNSATDLATELTRLHPEWDTEHVAHVEKQRVIELEQRTPPIITWQDLRWPSHCGDFCCYLRDVGKADLDELAPDGEGEAFFAKHLSDSYEADAEYLHEIWDGIRPGRSPNKPLTWSQGVYLFQCLVCSWYIIDWDCD